MSGSRVRTVVLPVVMTVGLLCGCASHRVSYTLDPSPLPPSPSHNLRVAVAPIPAPRTPYQCSSAAYGAVRLDREAMAGLLARHLEQRRVFNSQESTGSEALKATAKSLQRLKARGIDALVLPRVVQIEGGRTLGATDQVGTLLGSPALLAISPLEKTFYTATATVELKLVATGGGTTLWFGTATGTAHGREGLYKTVDASLKTAFNTVINDLRSSRIDAGQPGASPTPP